MNNREYFLRPGKTRYIYFPTFGSSGESITMSGLAVGDIKVYKDGGTTQRASTSGYTLLDTDGTDFDAVTGIHGISIDTSDNTTAGFWQAGSHYVVVIDSVTINSQTVSFVADEFEIGYGNALFNTTIATLASQTSFTLTAGPADNDALNGRQVVLHDLASAVQVGHAVISDYVGSTKTVTLAAGTTFTAAAGDNIAIMDFAPLQPTTSGNTLTVDGNGRTDVGSWLGTAVTTSSTTSLPEVDAKSISDDATAANNLELMYDGTGYTDGTAPMTRAQYTTLDGKVDTIDTNVDSILVDTAEIGAAGAGLTAVPWNSSWDAEVQSECNDALVALGLDHIVSASVTGTDIADDSIIASLVSASATADWDDFVNTTDSLQAIRDQGDSAWITATGFSTHTAADAADAVWDEAQADHLGVGTFGILADEIATIDTVVDSILVDTAEIGAAGAGLTEAGGTGDQLTAVPWNAAWDAEVQSEANDALVALGLDHLVSASVTGTDIADDSIIAQMVSSSATADWDSFVNTDDSLQAISESGGGGPTAAQIADAVWDEAQADHTSAGTFGEVATEVASILVDTAEIGTAGAGLSNIPWNASWDAEVQSEVNDGLVALGLDHLVSTSVTGTDIANNSIIAYMASSAATADWDTFVNTDDSLQAISESGGGGPTAAQIADAVWDEAQADHTTADTFGVLASEIATIDTVVDSILVDTAEIGSAGAGLTNVPWNASWDAEVQSEVNDGLVAVGLDHLVSAAVTGTDVTDNSIVAKIVSASATADWDDFVNTTDSLQAVRDRGDAEWATATGFSTHSAADVWTSGTRTLTAATNITSDGNAITMSSSGVVGTVNVVNTTTTNTDMRGTDSAALATALATVDTNVDAILADTGTDGVVIATATAQSIADEVLKRGASNIEDTADKHSLGAVVMISTNASLSSGTLTAKKPSDDTTFQTYTVTTDSGADPVTGVA